MLGDEEWVAAEVWVAPPETEQKRRRASGFFHRGHDGNSAAYSVSPNQVTSPDGPSTPLPAIRGRRGSTAIKRRGSALGALGACRGDQ